MTIMTILKFLFVIMLVIPLAYVGFTLVGQLSDQVVQDSRKAAAVGKKKKR